MAFTIPRPQLALALPGVSTMMAVNMVRLIVFFAIVLLSLIVLGLSAHFAEILVPSELTRFVTVGLFVSATTLVVTTLVFLLGIFRTYIYAAQTRVELSWLGLLSILWMALAVFLSLSADVEIDCSDGTGAIEENQSVGMSAAEFDAEYRAIEACSFINAILLVGWFLLLLSSALAHHVSGHTQVWRTPVADYAWFDNPVGARQRQKARLRAKAAGAGLTGEFSSSEEEVRGRTAVRSRVRGRSRDAVREKAGLPGPSFQPFYDPPIDRPRPTRASTQPLNRGLPISKPFPPTPVTPTRPGPPVRTESAPRLRQTTPPPPPFRAPLTPTRPGPPVRTESAPRLRQPTPPPAARPAPARQATVPAPRPRSASQTRPAAAAGVVRSNSGPRPSPVTPSPASRSNSQTRTPQPLSRSNSGPRPSPTAPGGLSRSNSGPRPSPSTPAPAPVSRSNSQTRKNPTSPAVTTPVRPSATAPGQSRPGGSTPVRRGTDPPAARAASSSRPQPTRTTTIPTPRPSTSTSAPAKPPLPRSQSIPVPASRPAQPPAPRGQTIWTPPQRGTGAGRDSRGRSQDPADRV